MKTAFVISLMLVLSPAAMNAQKTRTFRPDDMFQVRQDKRVKFVRYPGETHVITYRVNVLHMWEQMEDWLNETMPAN